MTEEKYDRTTVTQEIEGVQAIVNTEPGEIYIDIPATNPRYIHVREGDQIVEGDIRSRTQEELESPTLAKWRIDSISEDTVTGSNTDTGERKEWNREWLVKRLGIGEYSVGLRDFGRVSVIPTGGWERGADDADPSVIVMVYANNGQRFRQEYTADRSGDWESLTPGDRDPRIEKFDTELRERFDEAVITALETEQRYP